MQKPSKLHQLLNEISELRNYILAVVLFVILSYSVYLIFDNNTICKIGSEDGVFEYLTAVFFLTASIFFFRTYLSQKNLFFLLLSVVFFLGFGEEISWGQRLIDYQTPDLVAKLNVQNELTFHNIEIFNGSDFQHNAKTGFAKLLTINFQYKIFWLIYCVLLPIGAFHIRSVFSITQKMRLPVPPISIGIFFLINWIIFRVTLSFFLPPHETAQYYDTIGEIRECLSAFLFMTLSFYFFRTHTTRFHLKHKVLSRTAGIVSTS